MIHHMTSDAKLRYVKFSYLFNKTSITHQLDARKMKQGGRLQVGRGEMMQERGKQEERSRSSRFPCQSKVEWLSGKACRSLSLSPSRPQPQKNRHVHTHTHTLSCRHLLLMYVNVLYAIHIIHICAEHVLRKHIRTVKTNIPIFQPKKGLDSLFLCALR